MGYLFLGIALVLSKVKGFCSKKLSGFTSRGEQILLVSLLRMTVCSLFGAVFVVLLCGVKFKVDSLTLLIAFINGLSTALFVYTWMLCVRTGAYTMIDVFLTLGIVVQTCF